MEPPPQVKSRGRGTWRQSLHLGRFPFRVIGNDGDSVRCLFIINPFSCAPLFIAQTEATERLFIRFFFASSVILYTGRWVASSSFFFNEQHNPVSHFFLLRLHSSISVCWETRGGLRGGWCRCVAHLVCCYTLRTCFSYGSAIGLLIVSISQRADTNTEEVVGRFRERKKEKKTHLIRSSQRGKWGDVSQIPWPSGTRSISRSSACLMRKPGSLLEHIKRRFLVKAKNKHSFVQAIIPKILLYLTFDLFGKRSSYYTLSFSITYIYAYAIKKIV